ncbi:MAG: TetR/AcrR family transcriptional regulator, partial [Lactobacillus johnsonii]|nr:TetR/AcrR family transcriptional regulator [Lactobacillus johnsonii]
MAKKRALDRSKVIDQAITIISEKGLSELTMPTLAKALGIRS